MLNQAVASVPEQYKSYTSLRISHPVSATIHGTVKRPTLPQAPPLPPQAAAQAPVRDLDEILAKLPTGSADALRGLFPDLSTQPRYLALGGGLTAGFRNGGLYREAQQTSYPNLIARQMGLSNFRQPLFSKEQGNGSGYKKINRNGTLWRVTEVTNNLAIQKTDPLTFTPYVGEVDNLGLPYQGIYSLGDSQFWRSNSDIGAPFSYDLLYRHYFRRFLPDDEQQWTKSVGAHFFAQQKNISTIELGLDDFIWYASSGAYQTQTLPSEAFNGMRIYDLLSHLKSNSVKSVIATVPDILDFPYFKLYTPVMARQQNGGSALYAMISDDLFEESDGDPRFVKEVSDQEILLPTATVLDLVSPGGNKRGLAPDTPLRSADVLTEDELQGLKQINSVNDLIRHQASRHTIPVFDLNELYKRILAGNYVSDDGFAIDPSFPEGNFFSQDGLYPSAIGQAVLANEWIKVFNQHYRTRIPLINIGQYSQLIGK